MQLTGGQFTLSTALAGNDLATFPDFPAEIRAPQGTTFGVSAFQINFGSTAIETAGDQPDVLIAMNPAALKVNAAAASRRRADHRRRGRVHRPQPRQGGLRAEPARGRQPRQMAGRPLQHLAADARCREAVRPRQQGSAALQEHVDAGPGAVDVRPRPRSRSSTGSRPSSPRRPSSPKPISPRSTPATPMARRSRWARRSSSTTSPPRRPSRAFTAPSPAPKRWRSASSRAASSPGVKMFFGGYPITPASALLHHLARLKEFGITTFQAEDEIAAICAAIGASYAGQLGITSSSGPGIALKTEAMGLAVMTELPLVDRQFAARRPFDRPSDQDRAIRPLPGGLWPQRRLADPGHRRALARRRVRLRDRGLPHRDPIHDAGDPADRRLYRQCRRAVARAGHERLRSRSRSVLRHAAGRRARRHALSPAATAWRGRGSSPARRVSSTASAGSRSSPAPATSTIRPARTRR